MRRKKDSMAPLGKLSRRERQIMDLIYRQGEATVADVLAALPDPPSYSAVRAALRILEEKGHLRHVGQGLKYLYQPTLPREKATHSALRQLLETFFENSAAKAVCALLESNSENLSEGDWERIEKMVKNARKNGGAK